LRKNEKREEEARGKEREKTGRKEGRSKSMMVILVVTPCGL
jgi:hypothetical protein